MRLPGFRGFTTCPFFLLLAVAACDRVDERSTPVEPQFTGTTSLACDFGDMSEDAEAYFPGYGEGSQAAAVLELIDLLEQDCAADDRAAFTAHWFEIASILESVLEAGDGGDPDVGGSFLTASVGVLGPDGKTPMFDPCGGDAGCVPWEGFPSPPDFARVLGSPDGAWAVVLTTAVSTAAVCSNFEHPCSWSSNNGDAWGTAPSPDWEGALAGRTTVVFGHPLTGPSPTGEPLLDADLPAYRWLLIPDPREFGTEQTPAHLEVGLCSTTAATIDEAMVQKGSTVLTEVGLGWCDSQPTSAGGLGANVWDRLTAFLSPAPSPLIAGVALRGPGGSAGGFTDFYAVDLPRAAILALSSQPADGTVGEPIIGVDGDPLRLRALTSSMGSSLENASVTVEVVGNRGLVASGNSVSAANLICDGFFCTAATQSDRETEPGRLDLGLIFSKPGAYRVCLSAQLPPFVFEEVCTDKFNIRPHQARRGHRGRK